MENSLEQDNIAFSIPNAMESQSKLTQSFPSKTDVEGNTCSWLAWTFCFLYFI